MTSKHTPGPWKVFNGTDVYPDDDDTEGMRYIADCAPVYDDLSFEQRRANARLIAAAPDLLAVARIIAAMPITETAADDVPLYGLDGVYLTHGHIRAARAAIAKAEGAEC